MNHCAVTADLNRYLAECDERDAIDALIEQRTEANLEDDCHPWKDGNWIEAIDELTIEQTNAVSNAADDIDRALLLIGMVKRYWHAQARRMAERSIEDADCRHCFDQGCRRCDPDVPY